MPASSLSTPATPDEVLAFLAAIGVLTTTVSHEAAFTVAESQGLVRDLPGAHTKNLFVKDKKGRLFLVVAEQTRRVNLKRLHEAIGASGRLSFGTAEQLMAHLGVTPGSVTALAVVNDRARAVTVVLDASMMESPIINCHPLVNTMTTSLPREGLLAFFAATGHAPMTVTLPEPPETPSEAG